MRWRLQPEEKPPPPPPMPVWTDAEVVEWLATHETWDRVPRGFPNSVGYLVMILAKRVYALERPRGG